MNITDKLHDELLLSGASIVGFADLRKISSDKRLRFDYGISIALALNPQVINNLNEGVTIEYYNEYEKANKMLDDLALHATNLLVSEGYAAYPQTVTNVVLDDNNRSRLPHKTVATLAGIGWIGKCALLVTEKYGSALRLTSVLTNAQLNTGNFIEESKCGSCDRCTKNCPGDAIIGVNWSPNRKREEYFNHVKCRTEARRRSELNGIYHSLCGVCILTCPYTQRYIEAK